VRSSWPHSAARAWIFKPVESEHAHRFHGDNADEAHRAARDLARSHRTGGRSCSAALFAYGSSAGAGAAARWR
jgi:hypothetical protein